MANQSYKDQLNQSSDGQSQLQDRTTRYQNYINGQWLESSAGQYGQNRSPHNGELLGEFPASTAEDAKESIKARKRSFSTMEEDVYTATGGLFIKSR